MKALAIDVGGTKIYATLVDEKGNIVSDIEKYSTPYDLKKIEEIFREIISKHEDEVDVIAFSTHRALL